MADSSSAAVTASEKYVREGFEHQSQTVIKTLVRRAVAASVDGKNMSRDDINETMDVCPGISRHRAFPFFLWAANDVLEDVFGLTIVEVDSDGMVVANNNSNNNNNTRKGRPATNGDSRQGTPAPEESKDVETQAAKVKTKTYAVISALSRQESIVLNSTSERTRELTAVFHGEDNDDEGDNSNEGNSRRKVPVSRKSKESALKMLSDSSEVEQVDIVVVLSLILTGKGYISAADLRTAVDALKIGSLVDKKSTASDPVFQQCVRKWVGSRYLRAVKGKDIPDLDPQSGTAADTYYTWGARSHAEFPKEVVFDFVYSAHAPFMDNRELTALQKDLAIRRLSFY